MSAAAQFGHATFSDLAAFDLLIEGDMTNFPDITPLPHSALAVVKNAEGTSCENS
jgi:hypothetical protein